MPTGDASATGQAPGATAVGQAPAQSNTGQQQQSLGEQVYGQAPAQASEAPAFDAADFPGIKEGETPKVYAARITAELTRARADAGSYRTQLREKVGEQEPDEQGLTEFQRLQRQLTSLQTTLTAEQQARRDDARQAQLITALAEAGATSPARAARMLDVNELELEEATGKVTGESLSRAIGVLKGEVPGVFTDTRGNGDGGAGNGGSEQPQSFNDQIRARAGIRR